MPSLPHTWACCFGLTSGGPASDHRAAESHEEDVLGLVRARYADVGPTLAREKLLDRATRLPRPKNRQVELDRIKGLGAY